MLERKSKHHVAEFWSASKMVLADLGRKITSALNSLGKATIIDEEVQPDNDIQISMLSHLCRCWGLC